MYRSERLNSNEGGYDKNNIKPRTDPISPDTATRGELGWTIRKLKHTEPITYEMNTRNLLLSSVLQCTTGTRCVGPQVQLAWT